MKHRGNLSGQLLELKIVNCLIKQGNVQIFTHAVFAQMAEDDWPRIFIVKEFPTSRLWTLCGYGKPEKGKTEFVLFLKPHQSNRHLRIRIECKHQRISGSTIDKLLMTIIDLKYCSPTNEDYSLIIVDGSELKDRLNAIVHMATLELSPSKFVSKLTPTPVFVQTLDQFQQFISRVWNTN